MTGKERQLCRATAWSPGGIGMLGRVKPRGSCQPSLCSRVLTHRELHSFSCYLRVSKGRHLWELWRPENFASLFLSCWVLKSCLYWIQMHSGGGEEPGCYYIPFGAPQTPACPCPFRLRVHCSFQNVTQVMSSSMRDLLPFCLHLMKENYINLSLKLRMPSLAC